MGENYPIPSNQLRIPKPKSKGTDAHAEAEGHVSATNIKRGDRTADFAAQDTGRVRCASESGGTTHHIERILGRCLTGVVNEHDRDAKLVSEALELASCLVVAGVEVLLISV